jgi:apolipoprotein N-acyltransferase
LVPFGEYLPLRFLFNWVLEYLELPMSDFSAWSEQQTLSCGETLRIGLSICYEDAFANEHRVFNRGSNVLVNISEDAWFGDSLAPHQRLQMAQMRARELSRPMVRSANSGPSAFIDHRGQILQRSEQFEPASLQQSIQPQKGATPYQRFGDWIVWVCIGFASFVAFTSRRKSISQPSPKT